MQDSPTVFLKRIVGLVIVLAVILGMVLFFSGPKTASETGSAGNPPLSQEEGYSSEEGAPQPLPEGEEGGGAVPAGQTGVYAATKPKVAAASTKPRTAVTASSDPLIRKAEQVPPSIGVIVYYDATGFTPANFIVRAGTSVRFINRSSASMRVGSVIQAGAPVYPELDQVRSVGRGGYYDFNFSKRGSWSFYNANIKQHFGSVIVQ